MYIVHSKLNKSHQILIYNDIANPKLYIINNVFKIEFSKPYLNLTQPKDNLHECRAFFIFILTTWSGARVPKRKVKNTHTDTSQPQGSPRPKTFQLY